MKPDAAAPRNLPSLAALAAGALILSSCGSQDPQVGLVGDADYAPASLQDASAVDDVVAATTRIGVDAQTHLGQGSENSVVSPASIVVAFAMLAEGANGPAAEELSTWLGATGEDRTHALSALQAAVLDYDGDPGIVQDEELPEVPLLHLANQVTVREDGGVKEEFLNTLSRWYDAGVGEADFTSSEAKEDLDAWVNHHTGGLIEESAIEPDAQTLAVIQNAILMAARWESPFDANLTRPTEFTRADGTTVEADSMVQVLEAQYSETDFGQIIRLPYTEGFAMDVVLPAPGAAPGEVTADDWNEVSQLFQQNAVTEVDLQVPVLDVETPDGAEDLMPFLRDQGLEATLKGELLDGIMESDLWIDAVGHQALLQVDEAGTLGAAVTEVEVAETSAPVQDEPPVAMHVDRPFTLRVVHLETEWPLFMATVQDPAA
ncbi:MAG: serpin family protein [Micrococcaceae bacterium]